MLTYGLLLLRYSSLLQYSSAQNLNSLEDDFLRYQMMKDTDVPEHVWKEALVVEDKDQGIVNLEWILYGPT